tara:strand:+ start:3576 stop:4040 length:465 start_codon:yes stop_codon:yes gene_type:complete
LSKNSSRQKDWSDFYAERYEDIARLARRHTSDPHDLVHHTYLRCITTPFADNPMGYVSVAMFREATRGKFKELYLIREGVEYTPVADEPDLTKSLQREQMQLIIDRLSWFDREVINLYLQGWKMTEVSKKTGIAVSALYKSVSRSKKQIVDALR